MANPWWLDCLACPECGSPLGVEDSVSSISCPKCSAEFFRQFGKLAFCDVPKPVDPNRWPYSAGVLRNEAVPMALWSEWRRLNYGWFEEELSRLEDGARLLDLGSGPGWFKQLFERFNGVTMDVLPFDYVDFLADVSGRLPLTANCVDGVMLSNMLEHVYRPVELLHEIARILRPGCSVYGTVPFLVKVHQAPHDFFRYTPFALQRMLDEAGFTSHEVRPLGNLPEIMAIELVNWTKSIRTEGRVLMRPFAPWIARAIRMIIRTTEALSLGQHHKVSAQGFDQGYAFRAIK